MKTKRSSGILFHPTSLPGPFSIGTLGEECFRFIDFLAASGQSVWQILPLGPTGYGNSPYSCYSAFAGNPLLICPRQLVQAGDLSQTDLGPVQDNYETVNYRDATRTQTRLMELACHNFFNLKPQQRYREFGEFCREQAYWLNDYAIFRALRTHFSETPWFNWPEELRQHRDAALRHWGARLEDTILCQKYMQFVFFCQWFKIKSYANQRNIRILGDVPIFVAHDSSDVWAAQDLFKLDSAGQPQVVAGVPPDYFSATGQRWGNPLYHWSRMEDDGFRWWKDRLRWNLELSDTLRIDHFRGFAACWEIPAEEPTAVNGTWKEAPGAKLFDALKADLEDLPLVAEDLGVITDDVVQLRRHLGLPGMKILQFAFDSGPDNPYLPHNIEMHSVVYTGTHDNNTTLGWWKALDKRHKELVREYLGHGCRQMPWDLIRTALQSRAELSIIPLQDILALPAAGRMNTPGLAGGNWTWRVTAEALQPELATRLASLCQRYGRYPGTPD